MLEQIRDNDYSFSIENYYSFKSLIQVKTLLRSHVNYFTGDIVYTQKLDGHRGIYIQTKKVSYIEFQNGRRTKMARQGDDVFVLDVEFVDEGPVVCDVLYFNRPTYDMTLSARMSLITTLPKQEYKPIGDFVETSNVEGYIFLNAVLPYDRLTIYKYKYLMTVDLLRISPHEVKSSDGRIYEAVISNQIGMIEELSMDLSTVIRVRDDKVLPNHSIVMAHTDLATLKDIDYLKKRKGLTLFLLKGDKVISGSDSWLETNVTDSSKMAYDDEEDLAEELFSFDIMDKDGNFTPEYKEYKLRYFENKSTHAAYINAIQPEDFVEEPLHPVEDFKAQILIDEKIIQKIPGGYQAGDRVFKDISEAHPQEIFSAVPEIRHFIDAYFKTREQVFGPLIKCEVHNTYCATQSQCVRRLLFYPDSSYKNRNKCGEHPNCYKYNSKCNNVEVLWQENRLPPKNVKKKGAPVNSNYNSAHKPKYKGNQKNKNKK